MFKWFSRTILRTENIPWSLVTLAHFVSIFFVFFFFFLVVAAIVEVNNGLIPVFLSVFNSFYLFFTEVNVFVSSFSFFF